VYEKVKGKEGKVLLWYTADRGIITKSREKFMTVECDES